MKKFKGLKVFTGIFIFTAVLLLPMIETTANAASVREDIDLVSKEDTEEVPQKIKYMMENKESFKNKKQIKEIEPGFNLKLSVTEGEQINDILKDSALVDISKVSQNGLSEVFELSVIADNEALKSTPLNTDVSLLALDKGDQDVFCDITYFSQIKYEKTALPNGRYGYRLLNVSGGALRKSDSQIKATKIYLGYLCAGSRYLNAAGGRSVGTLKNIKVLQSSSPILGRTYSMPAYSSNYYYDADDGQSSVAGRTYVEAYRAVSGYRAQGYLEVVIGKSYGSW